MVEGEAHFDTAFKKNGAKFIVHTRKFTARSVRTEFNEYCREQTKVLHRGKKLNY
jgi:ferric-dicitrate binding protein FerR (iron transport regulator)